MIILHADDNYILRIQFARVIEILGHTSVAVDDGARALELIQAGEHFDLIISDNDMPEMTGLELLRKVRSNPATERTVFVLLTGNDDGALKTEVERLGGIFRDKGTFRSVQDIITSSLP